MQYLHDDFFTESENVMESVSKELQNFGERRTFILLIITSAMHSTEGYTAPVLPTFLTEEKERAATRYLNITTIATFFSSVTATMLQMSITMSHSPLWDAVNFFWLLSLVFSVTSGISSLVGMTWRKSIM